MDCLIISGLSGAGKSLTVDVLEDIGYYCIDNMPVKLIPQFVELFDSSAEQNKKVAFVVDIRGGHDHSYLFHTLEEMEKNGSRCRILFLECSDEVLINRQKASRRRHPLDVDGLGLAAAIRQERELMEPMRSKASYIIDTTALATADLKTHLTELFDEDGEANLMISVCSFGFKYGIPHEADLVFDVRFLPNPFYVEGLRAKTGNDIEIQEYVLQFKEAHEFLDKLTDMVDFLIPNYIAEGKNQLVISVGCTGGKHRSVTLANELHKRLSGKTEYGLKIEHRDLGKDALRGK